MAKVGSHAYYVRKNATQSGAGNSETLKTNYGGKGVGVIYYDPNGGSRTGVILEAGVENGQCVTVVNTADAAETITFAAAGTSNVSIGASAVISQNLEMEFTWSASLAKWVPSGGTAVIGNGAVDSAQIASSVIQTASVTLTATEIVGTSAGDLGHADGAIIVAAPGTHNVLEFISAVMIYDFDTAAYTGGGNDLVMRQGTTAVSGATTSANLLGAAGDKIVYVAALAAAGVALTENSTLNLSSTAWTQPGTAAGVLRVKVAYRVHASGL